MVIQQLVKELGYLSIVKVFYSELVSLAKLEDHGWLDEYLVAPQEVVSPCYRLGYEVGCHFYQVALLKSLEKFYLVVCLSMSYLFPFVRETSHRPRYL